MAERYRHTQLARPSRVIFGVLVGALIALAVAAPVGAIVTLPVLALMAFIGFTFTSMTTIVTDRAFAHHFGLGVWRKEYALDDIHSAEPVRNRWWYGWGIRLTPRGWLYNTWGLDAVEIRLSEGRAFRVGTDEPRALADAIRRAASDRGVLTRSRGDAKSARGSALSREATRHGWQLDACPRAAIA